LCYDRKLFHVKDNEPGDSDNHYPFLWNDIAASIIWFLTWNCNSCRLRRGRCLCSFGQHSITISSKSSIWSLSSLNVRCHSWVLIGQLAKSPPRPIHSGHRRNPIKRPPRQNCPL
jgi:hypothetical protein